MDSDQPPTDYKSWLKSLKPGDQVGIEMKIFGKTVYAISVVTERTGKVILIAPYMDVEGNRVSFLHRTDKLVPVTEEVKRMALRERR